MAKDLQNRDVFGYYVDKGWMCVQVFFVRQGKLIERDVNLFPYYNDPDEDFLTYVGQFYQEKSHLVPNEVLIPQDIDEEAVEALVDTKILKPQRGEKKQLVNLAIKNARVSLEQKFNLLEKSVEKTQGAIENLGRLLQIRPQSVLNPSITLISWELPLSSDHGCSLKLVNLIKKSTANTRLRLLKALTIMPVCVRSFVVAIVVSNVMV